MKNTYIKILLIFLLFFQSVSFPAFAWYGAGISENWPHAIHGAEGSIVPPYYKAAPESYFVHDTITIKAQVTNPENNPTVISHPLYLKLWKVENVNADSHEFSESELYENHNAGQDIQSPVKTIAVGELTVAPGENSTFAINFTLEHPGYYQFDLTDLTESEDYVPGHIYAAGFLRVKNKFEVAGAADSQESSLLWMLVILLGALAAFLTALIFFIARKRRKTTKNF